MYSKRQKHFLFTTSMKIEEYLIRKIRMLHMVDTISLMYAWVLLLSQFVTFLTKIYKPDLSAHTKSGMIEEQ